MKFGKSTRSSIRGAVHYFIWGPEVEFGDCVFYTILTLVLLALVWLFTFERLGIHVRYSLVVWAVLVFFIWRHYFKHRAQTERTRDGNSHA